MSDGTVRLFPDSTGKNADTTELTRSDATVVERQRIVIGDDADTAGLAPASVRGLLVEMQEAREIQLRILAALQTISLQLSLISGVAIDDPRHAITTFN